MLKAIETGYKEHSFRSRLANSERQPVDRFGTVDKKQLGKLWQAYIQRGSWRCQVSPSGAHWWIENTCRECGREKK